MITFTFFILLHLYFGKKNVPFWPKYPSRKISVLSGQWDFNFILQDLKIPKDKSFGGFPLTELNDPIDITDFETPFKMQVPGVFDNSIPGTVGPIGSGIYRKTFSLSSMERGLLYFAGCSFYCKIWIDDALIRDHRAGGYSPFWINIPPSMSEKRVLTVLADNRYSDEFSPMYTGGDFYKYGGIHRDVILHELNSENYIRRVEVTPMTTSTASVRVYVNTDLSDIQLNCILTHQDGTKTYITVANPEVDDGEIEFVIESGRMAPWTPEHPNLQTLSINFEDDGIIVRFGMRIVGSSNGRFTLNGKVIKLLGVNRHTLFPDTGSTMTDGQLDQDLKLLKELNVNYVRGAHYPQDQRFLDRCDEMGIMVWEETLGPNVENKHLIDNEWLLHEIDQIDEMISASFNHPSVIFWGFYNEADDTYESSCHGYNAAYNAIRSRDKSRLVTFAGNHLTQGLCYQYADVISFNGYPGWYVGDINDIVFYWKSATDWATSRYPDKPFTISETGAGGIYEWKNRTDPRWSQKYQAEVLKADIEYVLSDERISGLTIWQFADIKANREDSKNCKTCEYENGPCGWVEVGMDISCEKAKTLSEDSPDIPSCALLVSLHNECNQKLMLRNENSCQCILLNEDCKLIHGRKTLFQHHSCKGPLVCKYIDVDCHRPGGENHKGLVDFWRRPKESFYVAKTFYGRYFNYIGKSEKNRKWV